MSLGDVCGRTAVVIGAAGGIGFAFAERSSRMARAWCSWIERLLGDASPMSGVAGGRPLNVPGSLECTPGYDHSEGLAPKAAQRYNFL